ncbi:MAG TPA: biotin/lipoyl-binding protein, partial [Desulfuromonadaceae bacterium]
MKYSKKGVPTMQDILKSIVATAVLSVLGISLAGCTGKSSAKEPNIAAIPVTVGRVQHVQERETISVSGTVTTPNAPANACFLVSGKVLSVGPREGEYVKKGQVLATIDPTDYQLPLAAAKALTDQARV